MVDHTLGVAELRPPEPRPLNWEKIGVILAFATQLGLTVAWVSSHTSRLDEKVAAIEQRTADIRADVVEIRTALLGPKKL